MKKVFIIHGAYGSPEENWIPWLKANLLDDGFDVIVPKFPTPENQTLENWFKVFDDYVDILDENTVLVGHSLGCPFIMQVLQKSKQKINAAFLVSAFDKLLGHPIDNINKSFVQNFDYDKIKKNTDKIFMFSGDNDPYIKFEIAKDLATKLDAKFLIIENGGHLNQTAGFTSLPILLDSILMSR